MNWLSRSIQLMPLGVLRAIARAGAFFLKARSHDPSKIRRNIRTNLLLTHPSLSETERLKLECETIDYLCTTAADSLKCWVTPPSEVMSWITQIHGEETYLEATQAPEGLIAIVPHMGNWEIMNAWVSQHASPTIMYKPDANPSLNQMMLAGRQRLNATLVPTDASGVKSIFLAIKNGGFSVILPDHTPTLSGGVNASFYGIPALTTTLVGKLASKTHCRLIALSCLKTSDGYSIYCDALSDANLWSKDPVIQATAMNRVIEKQISRAPSQYIWNYERFRRGDPALKGVYSWSTPSVRAFAKRLQFNAK